MYALDDHQALNCIRKPPDEVKINNIVYILREATSSFNQIQMRGL